MVGINRLVVARNAGVVPDLYHGKQAYVYSCPNYIYSAEITKGVCAFQIEQVMKLWETVPKNQAKTVQSDSSQF